MVKNLLANAGDTGLIPGSGRPSEGGNGNSAVFLPGEFHRQRNLVGYSPCTHKEVRNDLATTKQQIL